MKDIAIQLGLRDSQLIELLSSAQTALKGVQKDVGEVTIDNVDHVLNQQQAMISSSIGLLEAALKLVNRNQQQADDLHNILNDSKANNAQIKERKLSHGNNRQ